MTLLWGGSDAPPGTGDPATRILAKPLSGTALVAALFGEPSEVGIVQAAA